VAFLDVGFLRARLVKDHFPILPDRKAHNMGRSPRAAADSAMAAGLAAAEVVSLRRRGNIIAAPRRTWSNGIIMFEEHVKSLWIATIQIRKSCVVGWTW
jgi:hypothetical protein